MFSTNFPIGTRIIYTIQPTGTFFEVILPQKEPLKESEFDGNLIKAILKQELR